MSNIKIRGKIFPCTNTPEIPYLKYNSLTANLDKETLTSTNTLAPRKIIKNLPLYTLTVDFNEFIKDINNNNLLSSEKNLNTEPLNFEQFPINFDNNRINCLLLSKDLNITSDYNYNERFEQGSSKIYKDVSHEQEHYCAQTQTEVNYSAMYVSAEMITVLDPMNSILSNNRLNRPNTPEEVFMFNEQGYDLHVASSSNDFISIFGEESNFICSYIYTLIKYSIKTTNRKGQITYFQRVPIAIEHINMYDESIFGIKNGWYINNDYYIDYKSVNVSENQTDYYQQALKNILNNLTFVISAGDIKGKTLYVNYKDEYSFPDIIGK